MIHSLTARWRAAIAIVLALAVVGGVMFLLVSPKRAGPTAARGGPLPSAAASPSLTASSSPSAPPSVPATNHASGGGGSTGGGLSHTGGGSAPPPPSTGTTTTATGLGFAWGPLQANSVAGSGCGSNSDGEPAIHVSRADVMFLGSERGIGNGSDGWVQGPPTGGPGAGPCAPTYVGQPNASSGAGAGGGDIDLAWGSSPLSSGGYPLYVASLNGGSVTVSTSADNGHTFRSTFAQAGLPVDDREWIAAYGSGTSLLSFHDASGDIEELRATSFGGTYLQTGWAIPQTDYKAGNNEIGNLVVDHNSGGPYAYQSFVAPHTAAAGNLDQVWVAASQNGGTTWSDLPIPCSFSGGSLDHQFPNLSVAPNGTLWASWSDDTQVYTAVSTDHGSSWTCGGPVSTNTARAIFPWLAAGSGGVDLVYYGTTDQRTWDLYLVQNTTGAAGVWGMPAALLSVHSGPVCEQGVTCSQTTNTRQLYDDFGVAVDQQGFAHIAYSHDSPDIGGQATYTGYAVQLGGHTIGAPN